MKDNKDWKPGMSLAQCVLPDTKPETVEDFDAIRKWVDKSNTKLNIAIHMHLKNVHDVRLRENEKELLAENISNGLQLIEEATRVLSALKQELTN